MNLFRIGQTLADYTARITCAALWIAGINGYIFTNQHPDLAFKVALYGALAVLAFYTGLVTIIRHSRGTNFRLRDNIVTTAVMCWSLPGLLLTPLEHEPIVIPIGITFAVSFIILKPLLTALADRHDWKHRLDDKNDHDPTQGMPAQELLHND